MKFRYIILITLELGICSENYTIYHIFTFFLLTFILFTAKKEVCSTFTKKISETMENVQSLNLSATQHT